MLTSPSASDFFIIDLQGVLRNQPGFSFKHIPNTNMQHNRQESRYVCFVQSYLPFSQGRIISLHIQPEVVVICCFFFFFFVPLLLHILPLPLHLTFVSYSFSHVFTTLWFSIGLLFDSIANRIAAGADFEACQSHKYRFLALFLSLNPILHFLLTLICTFASLLFRQKLMKNSLYPLLFLPFSFWL